MFKNVKTIKYSFDDEIRGEFSKDIPIERSYTYSYLYSMTSFSFYNVVAFTLARLPYFSILVGTTCQ